MQISRLKIGLLCATIGLLLYWVLQNDLFLPLRLTVGYEANAPKGLVAYIDSGQGFNEDETLLFNRSRFDRKQRSTGIYRGPPIQNLRLDPGYRPLTIILTSLCLDSIIRTTCWSAAELERKLVPANDVASAFFEGDGLHITRQGPDPFLVFAGGFTGFFVQHAYIKKRISVALALLLPLLLMWSWGRFGARAVALGRGFCAGTLHMTRWQGVGVFVLTALVFTGNWLQLDDAGRVVWAGFMGLVVLLAFYGRSDDSHRAITDLFKGISGNGWFAGIVAVLVVVIPIFSLLVLTWNQEFPYVGDQHFHLEIDRATYYFVRDHMQELSWLLAAFLVCLLLGWMPAWLIGVAVFFVLWSYTEDVPQYFIRYPGAGRFLAAPFFYLTENYQWDSLLNAARLANASGIVIWILVLRPLIVRRWPDWSVVPVAAAFFFQTEVAYYFTTSYLEAWSLIFVLLAIEHQIRYGDDPGRADAPLLLIGFAAIVKEAAIFMLPVVWLAGRPWRHGMRHFAHSCLTGLASAVPFLVYFVIRSHANERPFRIVDPDHFITIKKLVESWYQFEFHFGSGGILLCCVLFLWLLLNAIKKPQRPMALMLLGGTLLYFAYNFLEATSLGYAGYSRYYLFPFLLMCAGLFLLRGVGAFRERPGLSIAIAGVAAALNGQVLITYLSMATGNDATRNFTEHYDAPVFIPVRGLVDKADEAGKLRENQRIFINNPLGWGMPSIGLDYPDLARRYKLTVEKNIPCVCNEEKSVVLQPFIFFDGLNKHLRTPETRRAHQQFPKKHFYKIWADHENQKTACLSSMRASCGTVFEISEQGDSIGILGVR